jgi:catechol 2,3-dioxygenase-like lactoylglutathione lyase family enzyme
MELGAFSVSLAVKDLATSRDFYDSEVDDSTSGPASLMLSDPDGNQILIDQHR